MKTKGRRNKRLRYIRLFAALIAVPLICYTIYYIADVFFNGAFVDWFTHRFVYEQTVYEGETAYVERQIAWNVLKPFLAKVFLLAAAFFALSLAFVSYFSQKRKAEKLSLIHI